MELAAANGGEDAIHRARVATRRWFAALKAFDDYFDRAKTKALQRTLKRVMKASSSIRDCDVAEKLLVRLQAGGEVLDRLAKRRAKRSRHLAEVLRDTVSADSLCHQLRGVAQLQPGVGGEPLEHVSRTVLAAAFKDFLKRGERVVDERDSQRLHKFRIEAKNLRYLLELFSETGTGFDIWIEPVRQIQSLLGDAHDCEAVREMIAGWPGRKAVSARLKRRRNAKQRQFRRLWRERFARATMPHPPAAEHHASPRRRASPKPR